ncbi:hypothetical protein STVA_22580 [Allostella vacuolata]|nr:hypothetical protein STVA_22580 [Stella vacuolata]
MPPASEAPGGSFIADDLPRAERARRLRPYFDLQLRFAAAMAAALGIPLAASVARNTDFHRRFGLGRLGGGAGGPEWQSYLAALAGLAGDAERLDWTCETFLRAADEPPDGRAAFGCFAFDPPDAGGVVRLHFRPADRRGGTGPLARDKAADRRAELGRLVGHVRQAFPAARTVRGASWLYNVEAYRRLFPPAYAASAAIVDRLERYEGGSSWGQFLDHRGAVKADLADRFVAGLVTLDPARPTLAFPLPLCRAEAPIACFAEFYGI